MLLKGAVLLNIQPKFMWAVCDLGMKTHFPMQITSIMCEIMVSMYMCVCVWKYLFIYLKSYWFFIAKSDIRREARQTEGSSVQ